MSVLREEKAGKTVFQLVEHASRSGTWMGWLVGPGNVDGSLGDIDMGLYVFTPAEGVGGIAIETLADIVEFTQREGGGA